jgi:hypothetical protein
MRPRTGEKVGWIGGWLGGFFWLAILSVLWLVQGESTNGAIGLGIVAAAVADICLVTPWRFPRTPYWKLLLVPYVLAFGAVAFAIHAYGGMEQAGLNPFLLFAMLPILTPLFTLGRRRWVDGEGAEEERPR